MQYTDIIAKLLGNIQGITIYVLYLWCMIQKKLEQGWQMVSPVIIIPLLYSAALNGDLRRMLT